MGRKRFVRIFLLIVLMVLTLYICPSKSASAAWRKVGGTSVYVYKDGFSYQRITEDLKNKINGRSYKENPYIAYDDLRYVKVMHYNYKGKVVEGELIVNKAIAKDVVEIFYKLFQKKYQIQRMRLIDEYDANDERSMEANNTSAFCYRMVTNSTTKLSKHGYGLAVDVNPRVNPYISKNGVVLPKNGKIYKQRNRKKCKGKYAYGMIQKNDYICRLFKKYGFTWGGDWKGIKDYQHFER